MICIETHCHTHHSFDCNTSIESIIETCHRRNVKGIVVCDHDVCDIINEEERLFADNGIKLFKAIEFTTKTDAHVIGVSPRIKELQQPRFYYELDDLIGRLKAIGAAIIIPHPDHATGIIGNGKIPASEIKKALSAAHFVEKENYRYGKTKTDVVRDYPHLIWLIGSDAHSSKSVGAFVNQTVCVKDDFLATMQTGKVSYIKNDEHGKAYWIKRRIKKSAPYQFVLNLFSPELRRKIKNNYFNR